MENIETLDQEAVLELTTNVVSSYVSNNNLPAADVPGLIENVYVVLNRLSGHPLEAQQEKPKPAVSVRKSITDDYLICLEDGKPFKSLKRHLKTHYDLSPDQYRDRWGLPSDYPMVAPNYAKQRSRLAKKMGLGRKAA